MSPEHSHTDSRRDNQGVFDWSGFWKGNDCQILVPLREMLSDIRVTEANSLHSPEQCNMRLHQLHSWCWTDAKDREAAQKHGCYFAIAHWYSSLFLSHHWVDGPAVNIALEVTDILASSPIGGPLVQNQQRQCEGHESSCIIATMKKKVHVVDRGEVTGQQVQLYGALAAPLSR